MARLTRNRVFELLGAEPTNPRWSWCALSSDGKRAIFTIWEDLFTRSCQLTPSDEAIRRRHGAKEQWELAEKAIREKIPAYGILCTARDTRAEPRSIRRVNGGHLLRLRLKRKGDAVFAYREGIVTILELASRAGAFAHDGLRDIEAPPEGKGVPDRAHVAGVRVIRDARVRAYVLRKAGGRCEHCRRLGFLMPGGRRYLEAHHIIALAREGMDTVDNVIALCSEHHRQAHFAKNAAKLEEQFLRRIARRGWA